MPAADFGLRVQVRAAFTESTFGACGGATRAGKGKVRTLASRDISLVPQGSPHILMCARWMALAVCLAPWHSGAMSPGVVGYPQEGMRVPA